MATSGIHPKALVLIVLLFSCAAVRAQRPVLPIADFEGADYGAWKTTGEAFGSGPAHGALPGQMPVDGFLGQGFASSFHGGDDSTGTLTSPSFKIERRFLQFLIGGGGYAGETCLNLLIDGKAVRTATGPNTQPGGSERLEPQGWDVTEFAGRTAVIEAVDHRTGGWGHISVDQITQTDSPPPARIGTVSREIIVEKPLLLFPVKNDAPKHSVKLLVGGRAERFFEIEFTEGQPDWWAPLDVSAWNSRKITLQIDKLPEDSTALAKIEPADGPKDPNPPYQEPLRAQLRFSPRRGWNNDPNGLVFSQGEYHLFFQDNPYGRKWGNMHWGHAVSPDLVHWRELPIAIYPHAPGDDVFSGSAVVDRQNTSGWKTGSDDLLVAAFTSTGRGECITYSNDRGCTWTEYSGNPVVKHSGRDPRLLWYDPARHWVMAVYDEDHQQPDRGQEQGIAFYTSPDLKTWTLQSRIAGFFECPDLFELPLDGDSAKAKWVLTAANSDYMVGRFDGKVFVPETPKLKGQLGRGFYAAQTYSGEPKGRRVQIGWFQIDTAGMPFNQAMSMPLELTLRSTKDGPRLAWKPVAEFASLRTNAQTFGPLTLAPDAPNPLAKIHGELLEVRAEFTPAPTGRVSFNVRGVPIVYDAAKQELIIKDHHAPAPLQGGKQRLAIYADRAGFEVFASDGLTYLPMPIIPRSEDRAVEISVTGDPVGFSSLEVHELASIWKK